MSTKPREKVVLAALCRYLDRLKAQGTPVKWRKLHGSAMQSGLPDLLIVLRGLAVFCEVKRPGQKPTPLQAHQLQEWQAAGAVAFWADSLDVFRARIEPLLVAGRANHQL